MDSRHESLKEGLLNNIIIVINAYINSNTDSLVVNDTVRSTLEDICNRVYEYLGVPVEVKKILSNQNLLSIDTVLLPTISDPEASKVLKDEGFVQLINDIENSISKLKTMHSSDGSLRKDLSKVLHEYGSDKDITNTPSPGFRR